MNQQEPIQPPQVPQRRQKAHYTYMMCFEYPNSIAFIKKGSLLDTLVVFGISLFLMDFAWESIIVFPITWGLQIYRLVIYWRFNEQSAIDVELLAKSKVLVNYRKWYFYILYGLLWVFFVASAIEFLNTVDYDIASKALSFCILIIIVLLILHHNVFGHDMFEMAIKDLKCGSSIPYSWVAKAVAESNVN